MRVVVWLISLSFAIGFHFLLGTYFLSSDKEDQGAKALGEGGFEISLSMVAAQLGGEVLPDIPDVLDPDVVEEILEPLEPNVNEVPDKPAKPIKPDEPVEPVIEKELEMTPSVKDEVTEPQPVIEQELKPIDPELPPQETVLKELTQPKIIEPNKNSVEDKVAQLEATPEEFQETIYPKPTLRPEIEPVQAVPIEEKAVVNSVPENVISQKKKTTEETAKTVSTPNKSGQVVSSLPADHTDSQTQVGGGKVIGKITPDYLTQLRYWLERYKSYPKYAKRRKQQGVVHLFFSMNRQGEVLSFNIRKSSGHEKLDDAIVKMLELAQPLPAIPDDMKGDTLKIVLPFQFSIVK